MVAVATSHLGRSEYADYTWDGSVSNSWTSTTNWHLTGSLLPTNSYPRSESFDAARIYSGTVIATTNNEQQRLLLYVGESGTLQSSDYAYMNQPRLLTFTNGGTIFMNRLFHLNNFGALSLPHDVYVVGTNPAGSRITSRTEVDHNFVNLATSTTFWVDEVTGNADSDFTVMAPLRDETYPDGGTNWLRSSLTKEGLGTLELTVTNTYTGDTRVEFGTLAVQGYGYGGLYSDLGWSTTPAVLVSTGAVLEVNAWGDQRGQAGFGLGQLGFEASLTLDGGTLRYNGWNRDAGRLDRQIAIGPAGATLESSGPQVFNVGTPPPGTNRWDVIHDHGHNLTLSGAGNGALNAMFGGSGNLIKDGAGTWSLNAATNTYLGSTTVNAGTLLVNGAHHTTNAAGGWYYVANKATLGGVGALTTLVTVAAGGTLAPGGIGATGRFGVENVFMNGGTTLDIDIRGTTAGAAEGGYDQLVVMPGKTLQLGGSVITLNVRVPAGVNIPYGQPLTIVSGAVTGETFHNLPEGAEIAVGPYRFVISYGGGWNVVLTSRSAGFNSTGLLMSVR
jgi:autotransporter-associated beta strand protein